MPNLIKKTDKSFLQSVNDNLQIDIKKSTEEMQDSANIAHKCIQKLNVFLDDGTVPVGINFETDQITYSPLNPQSIKQIAEANNVAMATLRKIRGLDREDASAAPTSTLDAVLKAAYNKITIQQNNTYISAPNTQDDLKTIVPDNIEDDLI